LSVRGKGESLCSEKVDMANHLQKGGLKKRVAQQGKKGMNRSKTKGPKKMKTDVWARKTRGRESKKSPKTKQEKRTAKQCKSHPSQGWKNIPTKRQRWGKEKKEKKQPAAKVLGGLKKGKVKVSKEHGISPPCNGEPGKTRWRRQQVQSTKKQKKKVT